MAEPMKIRALLKGDVADIRVLVAHPMETGQRRDAAGSLVAAHFIQSMTVTHNGNTVYDGQWSQAVSRNPVFAVRVKGGLRIKTSVEQYDFSDFEDELGLHLGLAGPF